MPHRRGWRGANYYSAQIAQGTPVNPVLPIGDWENFRARVIGAVEPVRSAGSRTILELVEGMTGVELSYDISAVQASTAQATFLNLAIASPVQGELTFFTQGYGYEVAGEQRQVEDCKLDTISSNLDAEGNFGASVSIMGGKVATPAPALVTPQSFITDDETLQAHEATYSEFELSTHRMEYRNNLRMVPVIAGPSTTRDPGRVWDYLTEGPVDLTGSYGLYNISGKDLQANVIAAVNPTLRFVDKNTAGDELLISITGLKCQDDTLSIPGADPDIEWEMPWIASSYTWAATEY
jgi:hypothetical protein